MSLTSPSPALGRLAESAARILGHLGHETEFRRVEPTKDPLRGSETWAVVGDPVTARAHRFWGVRRKEGGVRERCERLAVERAPFEEHGGFSDEWEVLLAEGWTPLGNVALSEDQTEWEADLCPVRVAEEAP